MQVLNEQQLNIVTNGDGAVVINAGPGTGKTKSLVARVDYLINNRKVSPEKILVLTFTRKAVREIQERLSVKEVWIETFHSLALKLLKQNRQSCQLITEVQKQRLLATLSSESPKEISLLVSRFKCGETDLPIKAVATKYQELLRQHSCVDFDDLLVSVINNWENFPQKPNFEYILVDEFQDTSELELRFVKSLLDKGQNIWAIGDPNQSIYGFRGIKANVFNQFQIDFPNSRAVTLEINYRSGQAVLDVSHQLIGGIKLQMGSDRLAEVKLIKTLNEYSEADWIVRFIAQKIGGLSLIETDQYETPNETVTFGDFAVITRTHRLASTIIKKMTENGIPIQVSGRDSWLNTPENQRVFQALKTLVVNNPTHDNSWLENPLAPVLAPKISLINTNRPVSEVVEEVIKVLGNSKQPELMSMVVRFNKYPDGLQKLVNFWMDLGENNFIDESVDKLSILTMHAAKGLEFKYVFLCGFEDGFIPYVRRGKTELNEEKRLLYVALTRAREGLYLLTTKFRNRQPQKVSEFLSSIQGPWLQETFDEEMPKIENKFARQKLKGKQLDLF